MDEQLIQEIIARYEAKLGRPPDDRELASEIVNAGKYGLDQLDINLDERASNYTSDRPFDSSNPPSWYTQGGGGIGGSGGGGWNIPGFQPFTPPDIDFPTWNAPEWHVPDFQAPTPTTGTFTAPTWDLGAAPEIAPFDYESFVGPTAETFQADPGYDFRLKEGIRALDNAAAAQGIARTGGTWKGLMDYAQSAASQEFGNVWNRAAQTYAMNRDTALAGYDRNAANAYATWDRNFASEQDEFNRAYQTWNAGQLYDQNAYNQALGTWRTQFDTAQAQHSNALQNYLTQYGSALDKWNQAYQTWQGNNAGALGWFGANLNQQNSQWSNLLNLYQLATANMPKYTPMPIEY